MIQYGAYLVAGAVGIAVHEWLHAAVFSYYDVEHRYGISWSEGRIPIPRPAVKFHTLQISEPRVLRLSASAPLLLLFTACVTGYVTTEVLDVSMAVNAAVFAFAIAGMPSPTDMEAIVYPKRILERARGHYRQTTNHSDVEGYAHIRHELPTPEPIQR